MYVTNLFLLFFSFFFFHFFLYDMFFFYVCECFYCPLGLLRNGGYRCGFLVTESPNSDKHFVLLNTLFLYLLIVDCSN